MIFAVIVMFTTFKIIKKLILVLLESTPSSVNPMMVIKNLQKIKGVKGVHDLHIWSLSIGKVSLSVHLVSTDTNKSLIAANNMLEEKYGISHSTIQVEEYEEYKIDNC